MGKAVRSLSIQKENKYFAACSDNGEIKIIDLPSFEIKKTIKAYDGEIFSIQISPSNKLLASCGYEDKKVKIFDIENNFVEKYSFVTNNTVRHV